MKRLFKDLPIPAYFKMGNKVYQKLSKTKVREFGKSDDQFIRSNPEVHFFGQEINDVINSPEVEIV